MSIFDVTESNILKLYFNATAIANIADNASGSPITNVQVALHTADPGDSGNQSTSETAYGGYGRIAVARTSGGWTVSGTSPTQAAPVADITFATPSASAAAITNFSVGKTSSGATDGFWTGVVTPNITPAASSPVVLGTGTTITLD